MTTLPGFAALGVPADLFAASTRARHHDAVPDPGRRDPRRPRRPRRLRPGARPARARRSPSASRSSPASRRRRAGARRRSCSPRPASSPSRSPCELRPLAPVAPPRRRRRLRRRRLRPAAQGPRRRAPSSSSPAPAGSRTSSPMGAVDSVTSPGRRRRGRPHGRHGLPPRRAPHPRPDPRRPPGAAVLGDARRRRRQARGADPARPGAPRGRPGGPGHHRRAARCSGTVERADRPDLHGGDHRAPSARRSCSAAPATAPTASPSSSTSSASSAAPIHGGRSQPQRDRALHAVQHAARSPRSSPPTSPPAASTSTTSARSSTSTRRPTRTTYVHRSGRTARAGASGIVVSLVDRPGRADAAAGAAGRHRRALTGPAPHQLRRPTPASIVGPDIADAASFTPAGGRMVGTVTFFHGRRGYGFIDGGAGSDVFVHHTNVPTVPSTTGQRVEFAVRPDGRAPRRSTSSPCEDIARSSVHPVAMRRVRLADGAPMSRRPCLMVRSLEDSLAHTARARAAT